MQPGAEVLLFSSPGPHTAVCVHHRHHCHHLHQITSITITNFTNTVTLLVVQLRAMAETRILITPCGGTGTVLTFLPHGATAIIMNYWVPARNASVQMESLYYW